MPDANLTIGATVDKAAIDQGMADAGGVVNKATTQMGLSFTELQGRAKAAWKQISEDTKAGAASVSAEYLRIAQAAQINAAAQKEVRAATALTRNSQIDAAESTRILAAAMEKGQQSALGLAAAQKLVQETSHKAVTDVQATSAAIRSFEGNPGIRALEVFTSRTLGLGPVIQQAFPLIGLAAFARLLFNVGNEFVNFINNAEGAGKAITQAFEDANDKAQVLNDQLAITNDKLGDEIAKLSGHPTNGLATALDEGRLMADKLLESMQADRKELAALLKDKQVGFIASIFTGVAQTGGASDKVITDQDKLTQTLRAAKEKYKAEIAGSTDNTFIQAAADRRNEAVRKAFQSQIDVLKQKSQDLRSQQKKDTEDQLLAAKITGEVAQVEDQTPNIAIYEGRIKQLEAKEKAEMLQASIASRQTVVNNLHGSGKPPAEGKGEEQELRNIETRFAQLATKLPEEALAFWQQYNGTFKAGSSEYLHVLEQVDRYSEQFDRGLKHGSQLQTEIKEQQKKDLELTAEGGKALEQGISAMARWAQETRDDLNRTGPRWEAYNAQVAKSAEIQATALRNLDLSSAQAALAAGRMTQFGFAQKKASLDAQEYAAKLEALRVVLAKLQQEGAGLQVGDPKLAENQTKQKGVENEIAQVQGQANLSGQQDQSAINAAIAKPYLSAFDAINSGWLKVQADLIQGNKNIKRDFAQMGLSLVQSAARTAEQALAADLRSAIQRAAAHHAMVVSQNATDAAGAATATAISKTTAAQQGETSAKTAAKNTYATVSGWPVVGPFLAPVLAAGAFAAVAAFEQGGVVSGGSPGMAVPILAHDGERVLSAAQTNNFERLVNNNNGGGSTNIHIGGTHNYSGSGSGGGDFRGQLQQHRVYLAKTLKTLKREGHI